MRSAHPRFGCFLACSGSPLSFPLPPNPWRAPPPRAIPPSAGRGLLCGCLPSVAAGCSGSQVPGTPRTNFCCLFLSLKRLSARSLISELSGAKGREPAVRRAERLLSSYLARVCVWALILGWLSPRSRSDLEKQLGGGPSRCISPPYPTPSESPRLSSCSPLWGGLGPGAVSPPPALHFPLLLYSELRSTPLRPIPERSGLSAAGDDHGVGGGGPAGVSARAGGCRREPCLRCAAPRGGGLGVRLRPRGHPAVPGPGRSETVVSAPAPHLPWAELHFSLELAFRPVKRSRGSSGKASVGERGGFVFGDRLPSSR